MSLTYLEAITELQQRGFDAIKVAHSTQLKSLKTTRECATALASSRAPVVPSIVTDVTALMTSFTFQLLEQQVAYAKKVADTLAKPASQASPVSAEAPLAVVETAVPAPLVTTEEAALPAELPPDSYALTPALEAETALEPGSFVEPVSAVEPASAVEPVPAVELATTEDIAEATGRETSPSAAAAQTVTIDDVPVIEAPESATAASLKTQTAAAEQSETISKTLPAPPSKKSSKVPSVSNNRATPKRGPSTK